MTCPSVHGSGKGYIAVASAHKLDAGIQRLGQRSDAAIHYDIRTAPIEGVRDAAGGHVGQQAEGDELAGSNAKPAQRKGQQRAARGSQGGHRQRG